MLSSDKNASYEISELTLEWDAIGYTPLAESIGNRYQTGYGVHYNRIHKLTSENYSKSKTLINVPIKESIRSLRGVLILFKDHDDESAAACNRETFYNPQIKKVEISINGSSNQLYANGLYPRDLWVEARKFFQGSTNMSQPEFYHDKFALWIDTRSSIDMSLHGNGLVLDGSNTGLNLAIHKTSKPQGNFSMHVYLVIDGVIEFKDGKFERICYALGSCLDGDGNQ